MFTAHTTKTENGFKATIIKTKQCPVRGNMLVNAWHLPETFTTRYQAAKMAKMVAEQSEKTRKHMNQYAINNVLKGL